MTGRPLSEVIRMITQIPGRFAKGRGRMAVGDRADIVRFRFAEGQEVISVHDVWLAGQPMATAIS